MTRIPPPRHVGGSEKMDLGSDPTDINVGFLGIIDPAFSFCREIHWVHRSEPNSGRELQ